MGLLSKPKKPKASQQEKYLKRSQLLKLNETIEETEELQKLLARKKLGSSSLLSGASSSRMGAATASSSSSAGNSRVAGPGGRASAFEYASRK